MKTSKLLKVKRPSERNKPKLDEAVRYVLVRPGEAPIAESTNKYDLLEVFLEKCGGCVEEAPYPPHLEDAKRYVMLVNDAGLLRDLPYNRFGIVGTFVVVRRGRNDWGGLTEEDVKIIVRDLTAARTPVPVPEGIRFEIPPELTHAKVYVEEGHDFEPDLHYTGTYSGNPKMVAALNTVMKKHAESIAAYHLMPCSGIPGTFSLEFVFEEGHDDARRSFRAFLEAEAGAEYRANEPR